MAFLSTMLSTSATARPRSASVPCFASALAVSLAASTSFAHGLDAGRYTIEREGPIVRVVGTPRSADLRAFDDDGDGLLGKSEVRAHRAEIRAAIDESFRVTDGEGAAPVCGLTDVSTPGSGDPRVVEPRADHLRFTRVCRFDRAPTALRVHDHFVERAAPGDDGRERAPSIVDAVEVSPPVNGTRTLLREVETALLTPRAPSATVLRARASDITPSQPNASPRPREAQDGTPRLPWSVLAIVGLAALPSLLLHLRRRAAPPPCRAVFSPSPEPSAHPSEARSS